MNTQLYFMETNGYNDVIISISGHWYCFDCNNTGGCFGDVDLYERDEYDHYVSEHIAGKIAKAIEGGEIGSLFELAVSAVNDREELTDIRGLTIDDLINRESESCEPVLYTLIVEDDLDLNFEEYWGNE